MLKAEESGKAGAPHNGVRLREINPISRLTASEVPLALRLTIRYASELQSPRCVPLKS